MTLLLPWILLVVVPAGLILLLVSLFVALRGLIRGQGWRMAWPAVGVIVAVVGMAAFALLLSVVYVGMPR